MGTMNRRTFGLKTAAGAAAATAFLTRDAQASPNGTRPTKLVDLAAVSLSATQMRVSGRLLLLDNSPVSGLPVNIYAAGVATFTRWATVYTDGAGRFTCTTGKVPSGQQIQVEVEGNGAYCRPFSTLARV